MQFILTGFTQQLGYRVFVFERVGEDRVRTKCSVRADLALIRKYNIQIQDLPLLCRAMLERCDENGEQQSLTYSEEEMSVYASARSAARDEAARKKKPPHRPSGENLGAAWRAQHP